MAWKMNIPYVMQEMLKDFPRCTRAFVLAADIVATPLVYVAGSAGEIKTVSFYDSNNELRLTVAYKYEDAVNPTQYTEYNMSTH